MWKLPQGLSTVNGKCVEKKCPEYKSEIHSSIISLVGILLSADRDVGRSYQLRHLLHTERTLLCKMCTFCFAHQNIKLQT